MNSTLAVGSDGPEGMIFVEGGEYLMGSENGDGDEKPVHKVMVNSFYIDKYEVTQREYEKVMGNNPSYSKNPSAPVEQVSWNDAVAYAQKIGKRLPTEAEWEYAARGGNKSRGYTYSGSNTIGDVAWYGSNSRGTTRPVGTKQPNELGIYDMSGNVWEWCSDWYSDTYYSSSPLTNPTGLSSGTYRVLRGGSWDNLDLNCRVANRLRDDPASRDVIPTIRSYYYGFRCVQDK
jgi:formylglycine-generating enzyme required for sulfatase activity